MPDLKPVRGTRDLLPEDSRRQRWIEETAFSMARRSGYGEISTPIFEFTEVFARTLGDASDIVTKEMYTFTDRNGEGMTLRPENTAGIVRALISNGLTHSLPLRAFYRGPMFRYERPQKGRFRQFHQVGVELLGVADPLGDAEVIALAHNLLVSLGLSDKVVLELNSLGDAASRAAYRKALVAYLTGHQSSLSPEGQDRLSRNPLRILDSKSEGDRRIIAQAPLLSDYLNDSSRTFFAALRAALDRLSIPYRINPRLVRGLDYYCHTAFEFVTGALGAQGTVLAGGRYDGLVEQMGGPPTAGTGWAAGVERLMLLVDVPTTAERPIAVIPVGPGQVVEALVVAERLRGNGGVAIASFGGNVGRQMKWADRIGAQAVVMIGEDEIASHTVLVRFMDSGQQTVVDAEQITQFFAAAAQSGTTP